MCESADWGGVLKQKQNKSKKKKVMWAVEIELKKYGENIKKNKLQQRFFFKYIYWVSPASLRGICLQLLSIINKYGEQK